jgi:hypothetical protein
MGWGCGKPTTKTITGQAPTKILPGKRGRDEQMF